MKKIDSILVATDLRDSSDAVMHAAGALAALTGAKLHVLHALDLDFAPYLPRTGQPRFDDRTVGAQHALDEQILRTIPPEVNIASRDIIIHLANRAIVDSARGYEVDLVVIGPHRARPVSDAFLGSTADYVIRTADVPCMIVRAPLSIPIRHVVVPVDLSEPARGALEVAIGWATTFWESAGDSPPDTRVTVVHIVPSAFNVESFPFDRDVIAPELHSEVEAALAHLDDGAPAVRELVRWGDKPAAEIVSLVEQDDGDLVVMATHGHGALKRALIGSVASGVARSAPCPVLLVPPSQWRAEKGKPAAD